MLGCQDFCGYYEWTFHYLRRNFGQSGLEKYWARAVAADAQQHYIQAGMENGLRGLYESWFKTGIDELCEWTVTFAEDQNLLRLDMRECPSKGFLLENGLNADEDYCDHCVGWIGPALNAVGGEVVAHEHNHCGQCWWEMRMKDREYLPVKAHDEIRDDPRWSQGYLDRFAHQIKLPILNSESFTDPCDVILSWFQAFDRIVVLGDGPIVKNDLPVNDSRAAVVVTGRRYAAGDIPDELLRGVLVDHDQALVPEIAKRFVATPASYRPLLMHGFLPDAAVLNFVELSLPRPTPILPMLIRSCLYNHRPQASCPSTYVFAVLLSAALNKNVMLRGIVYDGYGADVAIDLNDLGHIWNAWRRMGGKLDLPSNMRNIFEQRAL